jgi:hypothetical protein
MRRYLIVGIVACLIPVAVVLTSATTQASARTAVTNALRNAAALGTGYESEVSCCQTITLGPQSSPTTVLTSSGVIPVGTYMVVGDVGMVMGPSSNPGGQEGTVCALGTSNAGDTEIGSIGGTTGNGATDSGTGPNGVYGNAIMTGTVGIKSANDHLKITCNSSSGSQGTYAVDATVIAFKVPAVKQI